MTQGLLRKSNDANLKWGGEEKEIKDTLLYGENLLLGL